jgi:hypothetical protein
MAVLRDSKRPKERELGLIQLASLRGQLNGHACLDELRELYVDAESLEKSLIITCFLGSRDPRAIPLFTHVLDQETDIRLRLPAAAGLAAWNVRRGVAELVELIGSTEMLPQPSRMPYVRDNAIDTFRTKNQQKGWGCPEEEIGRSIAARTDLDEDQKRGLYVAEIKKWYAENEQRFPNWKSGDPLPPVR